jgi:hypothetical protein
VRIVEPGPYAPDQRVTLEGSGFQVTRDDVAIGWCRLETSDGFPQCVYPDEGFLDPDANGNLRVDAYPMPSAGFGCRPPERCGLAWIPFEGSPPAFVTPFEMRPT